MAKVCYLSEIIYSGQRTGIFTLGPLDCRGWLKPQLWCGDW